MDSSYAADSRLCQRITSLAEKKSIPHQHIAMRKGAGEMGRLALGFGTLSYSITIPGRYSHCPHSVIARDDYLAAIRLASAIADEFPFE
jgi:putative aminopeptidase FrvX